MSAAIIFQAAMAYDLSLHRAWQADTSDVAMSWLPDDGSYSWIPKREAV